MKFNTNDLGYKLLSGKLRESRKQSEQLNKFVAGLFDSDGTVGVHRDNKGVLRLECSITQTDSNDPDGELLKALCSFYGLGTVYLKTLKKETHSNQWFWKMSVKHTKMLFNRFGKHLIIKRFHFQNLIDVHEYWNDIEQEDLSVLRKVSRQISATKTYKKHISPAYLAGLIAGDGHVRVAYRKRWNKKYNKFFRSNELRISIQLHQDDRAVLDKIKSDYGGSVSNRKNADTVTWQLSLGKGSHKSAMNIVPKLIQYSCLECKYIKLLDILEFHKQLAETK
ncbi:MAG: hypothetical protein DRI65_12830 [Chloroflexota bacterium]|nr:MAG: hypothetical protein DRI65_12830 [Chloroflexota bacterium]